MVHLMIFFTCSMEREREIVCMHARNDDDDDDDYISFFLVFDTFS